MSGSSGSGAWIIVNRRPVRIGESFGGQFFFWDLGCQGD
jgi:hypothetical protein